MPHAEISSSGKPKAVKLEISVVTFAGRVARSAGRYPDLDGARPVGVAAQKAFALERGELVGDA